MTNNMSETSMGFMRLSSIIGPKGLIPISKSSWFSGVKEGRYPAPVRIGRRSAAYRTQDILELIARIERGEVR
ncbi:helix-turn-helix transcriptional regulator [Neoaquamicrobium sediminum]|uniref:helix-turn-helix transcriptional regulator n=1 Tax=Neoaquamicrobium sediminum TaxID=1849104 RepID=UPI003BA8D7AC